MYFRRGNRFGLWRDVHVIYCYFSSRVSKSAERTHWEGQKHTRYFESSRPTYIPPHSSVNDTTYVAEVYLLPTLKLPVQTLYSVLYHYRWHTIVACISVDILLLNSFYWLNWHYCFFPEKGSTYPRLIGLGNTVSLAYKNHNTFWISSKTIGEWIFRIFNTAPIPTTL